MSEDFARVDAGISSFESVNDGLSSVLNAKNLVGEDISTDEALDATKLYKAARDFENPDVFLYMEKLDDLVMRFFAKCKVPVVRPGPILSMKDGALVMRGLLFSPEIMEAFKAIGPAVRLVGPTKGNFLTEVHVDIAFFEMVLSGESGDIRRGVSADVGEVIEA